MGLFQLLNQVEQKFSIFLIFFQLISSDFKYQEYLDRFRNVELCSSLDGYQNCQLQWIFFLRQPNQVCDQVIFQYFSSLSMNQKYRYRHRSLELNSWLDIKYLYHDKQILLLHMRLMALFQFMKILSIFLIFFQHHWDFSKNQQYLDQLRNLELYNQLDM